MRLLKLYVLVCLVTVATIHAADLVSLDINTAFAGTTNQVDSGFDITGSGADYYGNSDGGRYAYEAVSGDFDAVVCVQSLQQTDNWSKGLLMLRASTDANSANIAILISANNGFAFQHRDSAGASTSYTQGPANTPPSSWIRLIRTGNVVCGYYSNDGATWFKVDSAQWSSGDPALIGLGVTSHDDSQLCTAQFRGFSLIAPPSTVNGFSSIDLNTEIAGTTTSTGANSFTVTASGADLWNQQDSARLISMPENGDFSIRAQVVSMGETDAWEKCGVTLRDSSDPGSIQVSVVLTPGNGLRMEHRDNTNGDSYDTYGEWFFAPAWVRLDRIAGIVTAYALLDNAVWYRIGSLNWNGGDAVLAGLIVTAHNNSAVCTAQISNVSIQSPPGPVNGFSSIDIDTGIEGATFAAGPNGFAVAASGIDLWNSQDQARLVYQTFSGALDIRAQIMSMDDTDPWSKSGIEIRDTSDPGSIHASLVLTPSNGVNFEHRDSTNGGSSGDYVGGFTFPSWVRLIRSAGIVTALTSSDNIVWKPVDSVAWNGGDNVLVGMILTAHNGNALCNSQFQNVQLQSYTPPVPGSGDGLTVQYYNTNDLSGSPVLTRVDPLVDNNWGYGSPDLSVNTTNFSARWFGEIQPQYSETYTFWTQSDDGIRLWINGQLLVNDWNQHAQTQDSASIALVAGQKYDIMIEYFQAYGAAVAELAWSSPSTPLASVPQSQLYSTGNTEIGTGTGLLAQYFNAPDLSSPTAPFNVPVLTRFDGPIDFDWSSVSPDPSINQTNFSARWTGQIAAQFSETHTFYVTADDGVRLWVNNQLLVDGWIDQPATTYTGTIALTAGQKVGIKMEYYQRYGGAVAKLEWSNPSRPRALVPASQLYSQNGVAAPIALTSVVSPAFIEGLSWAPDGNAYTVSATTSAGSVAAAMISDNNWFVNVPLNTDASPTPVTLTQSSTQGTQSGSVSWVPLVIGGNADSDKIVVIRKGDSLLLTSTGNGAVLTIDANGDGVTDFIGAPGQLFPYQYNVAGSYLAAASIDGVSMGILAVTVMDADIHKPIADEVGYMRIKNVVVTPATSASNVVFIGDPILLATSVIGPFSNADGNGTSINITTLKRGTPVLVARIGGTTGPILTIKEIDEYTLDRQGMKGAFVNADTNIGGAQLIMRPYIPNIRFQFDMFAHTTTFANGTTSFSCNTSDTQLNPDDETPVFVQTFDPITNETLGVLTIVLEVPPTESMYCFRTGVFQSSSAEMTIATEGDTTNGCTCKGTVTPLVLCAGETGNLSISISRSNYGGNTGCQGEYPITISPAHAKFTADDANLPKASCTYQEVVGSTEVIGIDGGYCDVTIGGATFPKAITVIQVTLNDVPGKLLATATYGALNASVIPGDLGGTWSWYHTLGGTFNPSDASSTYYTAPPKLTGKDSADYVFVFYTANGHLCSALALLDITAPRLFSCDLGTYSKTTPVLRSDSNIFQDLLDTKATYTIFDQFGKPIKDSQYGDKHVQFKENLPQGFSGFPAAVAYAQTFTVTHDWATFDTPTFTDTLFWNMAPTTLTDAGSSHLASALQPDGLALYIDPGHVWYASVSGNLAVAFTNNFAVSNITSFKKGTDDDTYTITTEYDVEIVAEFQK